MKRFVVAYWPSMLVSVVILYATLVPDPVGVDDLPSLPHVDKLIHAVMFGGLTGAVAFDYGRSCGVACLSRRVMVRVALCAALSGGLIELLQGGMDMGRGAEWADFFADAVGAAVACFVAPPVIRRVIRVLS